jgi:hypothetical protein
VSSLPRLKLDNALDPWERQPDEMPLRHAQFCVYRDLGRARTLRKAAERLTKNDRYVRDVAAAFKWRERAEAYDRHLDKLYEASWLEERRKAAEVDAKLLGAAVGKIAQRLQSLDASKLTTGDLIRLIDVAMRHRRLLFGDPATTIITPDGTILEKQVRITERQGALLAEVIRRVADQLLTAVVNQVDDPAAPTGSGGSGRRCCRPSCRGRSPP